jgi:hypothetical protein
MNKVNSFDELEVYQAAFALQQDLFCLSKHYGNVNWRQEPERFF